jgi:hypothetical protein
VIDAKHFCLSQHSLLVLFLFELLELQVAAETSYHNYFVIVVENGCICLRFESALVELVEFSLATFLGDFLLFLF